MTENRIALGKIYKVQLLGGIPIYLGSSLPHWGNHDDNYFKGNIANFRIYTKALTPSEIYAAMFHDPESQVSD